MDDRPIGMFDSGFGGLTVARAVIDLLPEEHLVYIGDTGRYPYGPRPLDEVRRFARQITAKLVAEHNVKMVVVACNTAAAAGLESLRQAATVPIVSVVEPGLRAALRATENGRVGVIGTVGTVGSGAYQRSLQEIDPDGRVQLTCAACPGFVEFVERGETDSDQVYVLAERLLAPDPGGQGRHSAARLHPLSLSGPDHQRRGGARRGVGELGGRDRLRAARHPRWDRAQPVWRRPGWAPLDLLGGYGDVQTSGSPAARSRDRPGDRLAPGMMPA